jgi:chemotaxis signal transduction protein
MPNRRSGGLNSPVLLLLFSAGEPLYAMESKDVVEIIPRVSLRPVLNLPNYVLGLFNYHGAVVPVIDLSFLIQNRPSGQNLSSRIIMVASSWSHHRTTTVGINTSACSQRVSPTPSAALSMHSMTRD